MNSKPKHIFIRREQHQPSMHIVGKKVINEPVEVIEEVVVNVELPWETKAREWLSELTIGVIILYIGTLLGRLATFLFRLPKHEVSQSVSSESVSIVVPRNKFKPQLSLFSQPLLMRVASVGVVVMLLFGSVYTADQSIATLGEQIESEAEQGMQAMVIATTALQSGDYAKASEYFEIAQTSFSTAESSVPTGPEWIDQVGEHVPVYRSALAAEQSLIVAKQLALLGSELATNYHTAGGSSVAVTSAALHAKQDALFAEAEQAIATLKSVSPRTIPSEYRSAFILAQQQVLPALDGALQQIRDINTVLYAVSGVDTKQRYFLAFQNSNELRASGGFTGSYALVTMNRGEVEKIEVPSGGTYDVQGQQSALLVPPPALSLVASRWELQDANWWPDWPTSAQNIAEMYESAGGSTVDGVMAINASLLEDILKLVGPIRLDQYNLTLTSDNVIAETQYFAEFTHAEVDQKPKQIIQDMTTIVAERLQEKAQQDPIAVSQLLLSALQKKDVQLYHRDSEVSSALSRLGWDGALPKLADGQDTLAVVHTNIAGQKTDEVMKNSVDYSVSVRPDGVALATVTITREHQGVKGDLFTGVRNVNYVRVYAPEGSTLISAEGFSRPESQFFDAPAPFATVPSRIVPEMNAKVDGTGTVIYDELNRTVFANWTMTDPGNTSVVRIVYQLPMRFSKLDSSGWWSLFNQSQQFHQYVFSWVQQSGSGPVSFTHSLNYTDAIKTVRSSRPVLTSGNGWSMSSDVEQNFTYLVEYEPYE